MQNERKIDAKLTSLLFLEIEKIISLFQMDPSDLSN